VDGNFDPTGEDVGGAAGAERLRKAVGRRSLSDRLFAKVFDGLVYAQIWEDPVSDLHGLALKPGARLICIGSGGCNALSYLTADPAEVIVVDLNRHHVPLIRLKAAGVRLLPNYQTFFAMFGTAEDKRAPALYRRYLRDALDPETRAYWEGRDWSLRRRITLFSRNIYRHGALGRFIAAAHVAARLLGVRLAPLLECRSVEEQRRYFDSDIAPAFDSWLVRRLTRMKASLFGLGIPPAQYESLARSGGGDMAVALKRRLEKLVCDFPISENYFAQQAFGRRYPAGDAGPLPPWLQSRHYAAVRDRADRLTVYNRSVTERLAAERDASMDAYVLLDAQDWMNDDQLNALWREITRTAAPGAKVLFRTADEPSLLPGRVEDATLSRWTYRADLSAEMTAMDRSAIYGGVHLYEFSG
jgi:S-adenosylmethionine-diacylglycerol 3-amino-3-carboxypropyl transferase